MGVATGSERKLLSYAADPVLNDPGGTTTISGQFWQSRKVSFGFSPVPATAHGDIETRALGGPHVRRTLRFSLPAAAGLCRARRRQGRHRVPRLPIREPRTAEGLRRGRPRGRTSWPSTRRNTSSSSRPPRASRSFSKLPSTDPEMWCRPRSRKALATPLRQCRARHDEARRPGAGAATPGRR